TFSFSSPTITALHADGAPTNSQEIEFEPFNRPLHNRLQSLHSQIEAETERVAALRRDVPAESAAKWTKALERNNDEDGGLEVLEKEAEEAEELLKAMEAGETDVDAVGPLPSRHKETMKDWERAL